MLEAMRCVLLSMLDDVESGLRFGVSKISSIAAVSRTLGHLFSASIFSGPGIALRLSKPSLVELRCQLQPQNKHRTKPLSGPAMSVSRQCRRSAVALSNHVTAGSRSPGLPTIQRKGIQQDVRITRTGKPIISVQGGRSSLGGLYTLYVCTSLSADPQ